MLSKILVTILMVSIIIVFLTTLTSIWFDCPFMWSGKYNKTAYYDPCIVDLELGTVDGENAYFRCMNPDHQDHLIKIYRKAIDLSGAGLTNSGDHKS